MPGKSHRARFYIGGDLMNVLMLRHSAGYEHSYLPDAEVALKQLEKNMDGG